MLYIIHFYLPFQILISVYFIASVYNYIYQTRGTYKKDMGHMYRNKEKYEGKNIFFLSSQFTLLFNNTFKSILKINVGNTSFDLGQDIADLHWLVFFGGDIVKYI